MAPLISCVIPVHDGESFLAEAIESVLAQDHRPLELLVVDNGSTDRSAATAEGFGEPVRVVRQEDRYPPGGRNRGIRESRGDYLAFLDADDRYRPGKLTAQLAVLQSEPELDVCLCTAENFWEPGLDGERDRYVAAGKLRGTHTFPTMLARRSVFDRVGLLDEALHLSDQADWFLRAGDAGVSIRVLDEVYVDRRLHGANLSRRADTFDAFFDTVAARIGRARTA